MREREDVRSVHNTNVVQVPFELQPFFLRLTRPFYCTLSYYFYCAFRMLLDVPLANFRIRQHTQIVLPVLERRLGLRSRDKVDFVDDGGHVPLGFLLELF